MANHVKTCMPEFRILFLYNHRRRLKLKYRRFQWFLTFSIVFRSNWNESFFYPSTLVTGVGHVGPKFGTQDFYNNRRRLKLKNRSFQRFLTILIVFRSGGNKSIFFSNHFSELCNDMLQQYFSIPTEDD